MFERTAKPLLDGVLDGYNATVFAYGVSTRLYVNSSLNHVQATGCGKTYTISGTPEDPGVTMRIMGELFGRIEDSREQFDTNIELSMMEIYNENIRDLLNDDFPACPRGGLKLLESEKERVTVDRVTLKRPNSVVEVMELVELGNSRRSTSSTASNSVSSRSHSVLQINVGRSSRGHDVDVEQEQVQRSVCSATLSIIDLAGSEKAASTQNMGARMKEGQNINKSLLALSSCIAALCRPEKTHVPYRDSKLTRMLKFSLGGNCRTVMIVCVSPSSKDLEDTNNTLCWANKAKNVSTKISRNTAGVNVAIKQYLETITSQAQQIQILEAKLLEGPAEMSGFKRKKLDQARADARKALGHSQSELQLQMPQIQEGAKLRALWDGAEMRISALKRRIETVHGNVEGRRTENVESGKQYLQSIIYQQDHAYRLASDVQKTVQLEASMAEAAEKLFKTTEGRTFGDDLDAAELENVRLCVAAQRDQLAICIASAREKGYRQLVQQQADDSAQAAALLQLLISGLDAETDRMSGLALNGANDGNLAASIDQLRRLISWSQSGLNGMFGPPSALHTCLPPVPRLSQGPSALSKHPRRQSTVSTNLPSASGPAPSTRRVLTSAKVPASPRRLGRAAASPRKQALRPILRTGRDPGQSRKPLQWRDEAGKGDIDDSAVAPAARVFTSSSSSSSLDRHHDGNFDTSDEWDDDDEPGPSTGDKSLFTLPGVNRPLLNLPNSSSTAIAAPPLPNWKQNRLLLGKSVGSLGTLGEETAEMSSPEAGPSQSRLGNLGPPVRSNRAPLTERHQIPQSIASMPPPSTSSASSNIFKPTAASISRAVKDSSMSLFSASSSRRDSSVGRAPSSVVKTTRRASNIFPYQRGRSSIIPQPQPPVSSSSVNTSLISAPISVPPFSLLNGASQFSTQQTDSTSASLSDQSHRGSVIGPAPGLPRPRASSSMNFNLGPLPRGPVPGNVHMLNSRPSMSRLSTMGGVATLAGTGESSRRLPWK